MIRDLQDAINHAKEVAKLNREDAKYWEKAKVRDENVKHLLNTCEECTAEHEQLAAWLEQLLAIKLLYEEYKEYGGGFHYQVGKVFDGDYVLDNKENEAQKKTDNLPSCNSCAHNGTWNCIKCSGFDGYEKSEDK